MDGPDPLGALGPVDVSATVPSGLHLGAQVSRKALLGNVVDVAPRLLGVIVVKGEVAVRVTEVEAYAGARDPGSHAFRGETPRTTVMFGPAGRLYTYFTYGMHWCANVVCGPVGEAGAVLLRGGEVIAGQEVAAADRPHLRARDLARGPARLARALALGADDYGTDLCAAAAVVRLYRGDGAPDACQVRQGPRVGVAGPGGDGLEYPWRFWLDGEPTVSAYQAAKPRRPRDQT